jgi:hypothetical protein
MYSPKNRDSGTGPSIAANGDFLVDHLKRRQATQVPRRTGSERNILEVSKDIVVSMRERGVIP